MNFEKSTFVSGYKTAICYGDS